MGERRAKRILVGSPDGKTPLGRPRRKWGIILKFILKKWDGGMHWICLVSDRDRWRAVLML
jgi:hypothetical protein